MKHTRLRLRPLTFALAACFAAAPFGAVHAQATAPEQGAKDALNLDEVVVTAAPEGRTKMRQSLSISTLDSDQILKSGATSSADILRSIPGVRAEASGGEGNANVTVRGVPISAGGSRYVNFQEDGLPVLLMGDFNFVTPDMFIRTGAGTDGVEVVRGGSASTLATNGPGGVINFISKTGDVAGGSISATTSLGHGTVRRTDFGYGGPLSGDTTFYLSGYVRDGEGARDTHGVTMEKGGQLKAVLTKDFGGGNWIRFNGKVLDDQTPTLMTVPVNIVNGQIQTLPGVDPRRFSPYGQGLPAIANWGLYGGRTGNINDGLQVKSNTIGSELNLNLGNGWTLNDKFRIGKNSGGFNGVMPDGYPAPGAAGLPGAGQSSYTALFLGAKFNDVGLDVNDLKVTKTHQMSDQSKVTTTAGLFVARQKLDVDWEIGGFNSPLVPTSSSTYGAYNSYYKRNINQTYTTTSPYAAVAWQKGPLDIDASVRVDRQDVTGTFQDSGGTANSRIDYGSRINAFSLGANYALSRDLALFARASQGGSFHSDRVLFTNNATVCGTRCFVGQTIPVNEVQQLEAGVKARSGNLSTFLTVFQARTDESNYDLTTGRSSANKYEASGVELEFGYKLGGFRLNGGVTYTDAEVKDSNNAALLGKAPNRQAKVIYQIAPSYRFDQATVGMSLIGTTASRDAQGTAYEATLPAYRVVNAFASYDFNKSWTGTVGVNNLTNELAYTEVNDGRAAARALTGRTVMATLRYKL